MDMQDELFQLLRETNRDLKDVARDVSGLQASVARHDEILKDRTPIIERHQRQVEALEGRIAAIEDAPVPWKLVSGIVAGIVAIVIVAMYLAAGGNPEGVKELVP